MKLNLLNKKAQSEDIGSDLFPALIIFLITLIIIAGMRFSQDSNLQEEYDKKMRLLNYQNVLDIVRGSLDGEFIHENLIVLSDLRSLNDLRESESNWDKSMFYDKSKSLFYDRVKPSDLPFICDPNGKLENYFNEKMEQRYWYVVVFDTDTRTSFFHCASPLLSRDLSTRKLIEKYIGLEIGYREAREQPYMPDKFAPEIDLTIMTLGEIPELDLRYDYDVKYWSEKGWIFFNINVPKKDSKDYLIYKFAIGDR